MPKVAEAGRVVDAPTPAGLSSLPSQAGSWRIVGDPLNSSLCRNALALAASETYVCELPSWQQPPMDLRKLPFVFLCTVTACGATYASSDDALVRQLHDADQALLVAVHNGGRAIWESWTTADFAYVEEGDVQERDAFLKALEPDGSAGLRIVDYRVEKVGDTAIVTHRDDVLVDCNV